MQLSKGCDVGRQGQSFWKACASIIRTVKLVEMMEMVATFDLVKLGKVVLST